MKLALLPAAGKSTRMGRPKLALPLGERTILAHVLDTLRRSEIDDIVVVLGPHVRELAPMARGSGAHVCQLAEETADMRATVEQGLHWLEERFQPRPDDPWLLVPADHPALAPAVIGELEQSRQSNPARSIFVPTFHGRRGHPLMLTWQHVHGIRAHTIGEGLNTYVRKRAADVLEVPVANEAVLWDLDTPEDYEALRLQWPLPC
ncbi:MAG TPA: nucleotidyltransferase family protein [Gemmataceae bacterium]|nr:nucleotidyltransferase family protein [Gemmataceae bacterium]